MTQKFAGLDQGKLQAYRKHNIRLTTRTMVKVDIDYGVQEETD